MEVAADKNMKISVIVTVSNAEKHLKCCLESIVTQSFPYLEIICVNDGSTDKSAEILDEYAKKDNRIVIINQERKGAAAARNRGLDVASGAYITLVNASDFIEVNMLEVMLKNMLTRDSDVVFESVWVYDEITQCRVLKEDSYFTMSWMKPEFFTETFSYEKILEKIFSLPVVAWAKLYRASFLKESGVRFREDLIYEDIPFFFEFILKNPKISIDRRQLYNYRVNTGFSPEAENKEHYADMLKIMEILGELFEKQDFYEQIKSDFLNYRLLNTIKSFLRVPKEYERKYYHQIQNEFLNIDMLYYNEAILAKRSFYPMYCTIRNEAFLKYKFKKILQKFKISK